MAIEPASTRRRAVDSAAAMRIIDAVESLLDERALDAITVADILRTAGVARGTFYLWFTSKHDVVVQAHRMVTGDILRDASAFLDDPRPDADGLRRVIEAFVQTWKRHGPVLAASAEIWRSCPELSAEWERSMQTLVDAVAAYLVARPGHADDPAPERIAHALIWMNERSAYMAAAGLAPMTLGPDLVDTLTHIWAAVLFDR